MDLRDAWAADAQPWVDFARSESADPVFWRFNLPEFVRSVPPPAGLTLDLGCGEGRVGRALMRLGHRVVGIDSAQPLVAAARSHDVGLAAVVGDAARLPFRDAVADLAVLFMVVHDVDDLERVLTEAGRVLRPGGRLCLAMAHPIQGVGDFDDSSGSGAYVIDRPYFEHRRLTYWVERAGHRTPLHFIHRPLTTYTEALAAAGFVIEVLREPRPADTLSASLSDIAHRQTIPSFIHLRARREAAR